MKQKEPRKFKSKEEQGFLISSGMIEGIPVLTCTRNDITGPKPLVLLSHGFTGSKEFWTGYMKELAGMGYYTVALDNRLHGERRDAGFQSVFSDTGGLNVYKLFQAIKGNAEDIPVLIDYFADQSGIDTNRIAMAGVSMGGFTTYRAIVSDKRIKVAVPVISSPTWGDYPEDTPVDDSPELIRSIRELSEDFGPSNFKDRFYPAAILMQAGSIDKHYRLDKLKQFYGDLRPLYREEPSRLDLIVHEGIGHEFTAQMWKHTVSWLGRFL